MSKNIRQQLRSAVFDAFSEHKDKRALRAVDPEEAQKHIFSYGTRNQLLDRIDDFVHYLPRDIRCPGDINTKHIIMYLDQKSHYCTQNTVDEYRSELKKLGLILNCDYSCDRVYADRKVAPDRGAESVISKEDFLKLLQYTEDHPSASGVCLQLERHIGVRVSDLAYGIKVEPDQLRIRCKNGKFVYRPITPEIRKIIDSPEFQKLLDGDRVRAPKDDSINKYLRRTEDKLGLERHSFHDIRRRIAQDKYDDFRSSGMTRTEALSSVSLWLNHGRNRESMLIKSYISNAW